MKHACDFHAHGLPLPGIRRIGVDRPFAWLMAGWRDVRANPLPSLAYGLLFALCGDLIILATLDRPHLLTVSVSGFFLVAPLLAAGLNELSRQRVQGKKLFFIDSIRCFRHNLESFFFYGLLLVLIGLMWERFSAIAFALLGSTTGIDARNFIVSLVLSGEHNAFIGTWFALGSVLALCVFMVSVVTVPMMLDHDADMPTATATSVRTFLRNPVPLLLWAALLVSLTLIGFATLLFGLVVIMPILGHATWHAYRDLVE